MFAKLKNKINKKKDKNLKFLKYSSLNWQYKQGHLYAINCKSNIHSLAFLLFSFCKVF